MQRTSDRLFIRVGEEKTPITLTDSAVQAVQDEAAGKAVDAFASVWDIERTIEPGDGFASLDLNQLIELRQALQLAGEVVDVLIECRPIDEVEVDDAGA